MALNISNALLAISAAGSLTMAMLQPANQQPSNPRPSNPSPQPSNPNPQPANPNPSPQQPGDRQPGNIRPGNPQPRPQPVENRRPDPGQRDRAERMVRPFGFASPDMETRFLENARRLDAAERRLGEMNADMTRRLATVRELPAETQTAAVIDLLEQMLEDRAALNRYLIQSRSMWTGDLEDVPAAEPSNPGSEPRPRSPEIPPVRSPR